MQGARVRDMVSFEVVLVVVMVLAIILVVVVAAVPVGGLVLIV